MLALILKGQLYDCYIDSKNEIITLKITQYISHKSNTADIYVVSQSVTVWKLQVVGSDFFSLSAQNWRENTFFFRNLQISELKRQLLVSISGCGAKIKRLLNNLSLQNVSAEYQDCRGFYFGGGLDTVI